MTTALWIALALLVVVLAVLQIAGVRALRAWGAQPSTAVIALRVMNFVIVVGLLLFVFWKWVM